MKGYCSWCLKKITPLIKEKSAVTRNIFICPKCNYELVKCRACRNYARWGKRIEFDEKGHLVETNHHDQFCLEHRHEIRNFSTMSIKIREPSDYRKVYTYNSVNLAKAGKIALIVGGGTVLGGPLFYIAAPAIGGAIGVAAGLSGAVATNYGLALLGFGSLAAGGFGMAGGMVVSTAVGSALGGAVGAYVGNSYLGDIKNFDIKKVRSGKPPAVVTINGFISEQDKKNEKGYQDWQDIIQKEYQGNEWYHVYWESKNLWDLGSHLLSNVASGGVGTTIVRTGLHASNLALKKVAPAATITQLIQLSKNPWHVALVKAEKTGVLLADILSRTNKEYILLGHSLGGRVIYATLRTLATRNCSNILEAHITGGAIGNNRENWKFARKAVKGRIVNYFSRQDRVLKYLYTAGTFFSSSPIGRNPIRRVVGIRNKDVSSVVEGHMKYKSNAAKFWANTHS
jgi:hypothetical protein